jgi:hypothetical protein
VLEARRNLEQTETTEMVAAEVRSAASRQTRLDKLSMTTGENAARLFGGLSQPRKEFGAGPPYPDQESGQANGNRAALQKKSFQTFQTFQSTLTVFLGL